MKRVVFLGSKPIGYLCLKHLIDNKIKYDIDISAVLTKENINFAGDHSIAELAKSASIVVLQHPDDLLELDDFDFLISVQYHLILRKKHIDCAKELAVNLHMAPLPEYRGCNQFSFAIINGDTEFGTTLHVLDEGIDSGDILFEKRFPLGEKAFIKELYDDTFANSIELFEESIGEIFSGEYERIPQVSLFETRGTSIHYRKEINDIKCLDLSWDEDKLDRYIRATSMPGFAPPFTIIKGIKYSISTIEENNE